MIESEERQPESTIPGTVTVIPGSLNTVILGSLNTVILGSLNTVIPGLTRDLI